MSLKVIQGQFMLRPYYNLELRSYGQRLFLFHSRAKNDFLEILLYYRNQVDHKIALGLGGGFQSFHSSIV